MSANLQRCQHCGSKVELIEEPNKEFNCSLWAIRCNGCPVMTDSCGDRIALVESWNRKAAPKDIKKKVKKAIIS